MTLEELKVIAILHGIECQYCTVQRYNKKFIVLCEADGIDRDAVVLELAHDSMGSRYYEALTVVMYNDTATIIDVHERDPQNAQKQFEFLYELPVRIYPIE